MTDGKTTTAYGELIEPDTLRIERFLPGPVERVWAYLTESDLRRLWLASGEISPAADTSFELVWRNDELTSPPGERPQGHDEESRMQSRILVFDPPRRLVITWGFGGEVSFELEPKGGRVLLTLTHRRLPDRPTRLMIGAGWHMHLDILVARAGGTEPKPFWDGWNRLRDEYDARMPK